MLPIAMTGCYAKDNGIQPTKKKRLPKQAYYQNSFNEHTGDSRKTWQTIA